MKLTQIETIPLEVPLARVFRGSHYSMDRRATIITRVHTDEGVIGESYNGDDPETQHAIAAIISEEIAPRLHGRHAREVERCWEEMLPLTFDILRDRRAVILAMASVDSALWDLLGKVAGLPLATLWGGYTTELPIIAIGGYYEQTHAELGAEVEAYRELGLAGCKMKVGGASPADDAARFRAMRQAGGDDFVLIADANQGYTVTEAVEFCRLVADAGLRWFEEPVRWNIDRVGLRDVRFKTGVPVAAGQSEISLAGVRELAETGAIDVCNFDASWAGGPTEWRRVAGLACAYGIEMAHHEEPQIAAHLLASVAHGTYVECFHPDRDPLFWNLIANRPPITDGVYPIPDGPGFGLVLDEAYIERYRVDR
jgi:D-galactarolactone cycloisomerase